MSDLDTLYGQLVTVASDKPDCIRNFVPVIGRNIADLKRISGESAEALKEQTLWNIDYLMRMCRHETP